MNTTTSTNSRRWRRRLALIGSGVAMVVTAAVLISSSGVPAQTPIQPTAYDAQVQAMLAERQAQTVSRSVRIGWCGGPEDQCLELKKGPSPMQALLEAEAKKRAAELAAARAAKAKAAAEAKRKAKQAEARKKAAQKSKAKPRSGGSTGVGPVPKSCSSLTGNRKTGCTLMVRAGFGMNQWGCLDRLWKRESGWNHKARNPSSGAFGIPQSLPASKMASAGSDWRTNPATQIRWGLGYIKGRYGSPCSAWAHSERTGWY